MKIAPIEIRNAEFPKRFRGFDPERVKSFLEMVADELEEIIKENISLSERIKDLDIKVEDYRRMENILKEALLTAQKGADELKRSAEKEAELLIMNAKMEAEKLLEEKREELNKLKREIEEIKARKKSLLLELKAIVETQKKWVDMMLEKEG
ncbi:MAG: DivIVA domain-containing protein [candidate division WOR-3 bacterium]